MISATLSKRLLRVIGYAVLCLMAATARAGTVQLGTLSYDTFIPANGSSPGVDAFDLSNLTGAFSLPPDFPVTDDLTFQSVTLTLTLSNLSQTVFVLGNIGPGFLLDSDGNPIVQVPSNEAFDSAELTATLSATVFNLSGGGTFTAGSPAIDVLLLPSSGTSLTVDVDQTTISVSTGAPTSTPEPGSFELVLVVSAGLAWGFHRKRSRANFRELT